MNKIFENIYNALQKAKSAYKISVSDEEKNRLSLELLNIQKQISSRGTVFTAIYSMYETARDFNNKYLTVRMSMCETDIEGIINGFRKWGITEFAFRVTGTCGMDTSWKLIQMGCILKGMTEVNIEIAGRVTKQPSYLYNIGVK